LESNIEGDGYLRPNASEKIDSYRGVWSFFAAFVLFFV